jgi:hypothetical protein
LGYSNVHDRHTANLAPQGCSQIGVEGSCLVSWGINSKIAVHTSHTSTWRYRAFFPLFSFAKSCSPCFKSFREETSLGMLVSLVHKVGSGEAR